MTGRKFYFEQEDKGIIFRTNRKIGDVRIPNYVYDIWMPVIGSDAIGVYGVYCRLEMNGSVKKISQRTLAKACRIGVNKLNKINGLLELCGFIEIDKPTGHKRLMHFTTEIAVNDPPQAVSAEILDVHCPDFEPLTPWLMTPETPFGVSDNAKQCLDETPNGDANIASLGLHPLGVEPDAPSGAVPQNSDSETIADFFNGDVPEQKPQTPAQPVKLDFLTHTAEQAARRDDPKWFIRPGQPCGDHPYLKPYRTFCAVVGRDPSTIGEHKTMQWLKQLEKIAHVGGGIVIIPDVMARAIKAIRGNWSFKHKVWTTPYSDKFAELVEYTAARIDMGVDVEKEIHNATHSRDNGHEQTAPGSDSPTEISRKLAAAIAERSVGGGGVTGADMPALRGGESVGGRAASV